jgi:hypothetical protein
MSPEPQESARQQHHLNTFCNSILGIIFVYPLPSRFIPQTTPFFRQITAILLQESSTEMVAMHCPIRQLTMALIMDAVTFLLQKPRIP